MTEIRPPVGSIQESYLVVDKGIISGLTVTVRNDEMDDQESVWLDSSGVAQLVIALVELLVSDHFPFQPQVLAGSDVRYEAVMARLAALEAKEKS